MFKIVYIRIARSQRTQNDACLYFVPTIFVALIRYEYGTL